MPQLTDRTFQANRSRLVISVLKVEGGSLAYLKREQRRFRPDKDWWIVDQPYHIYTEREGHLIVPTGFETDGASVPRMFWRLMPPMSEYTRIAVVHDFFYRSDGLCMWEFEGSLLESQIDRPRADEIFRDGMKYLDVARWKIPIMYRAVRAFGGGPWQSAAA